MEPYAQREASTRNVAFRDCVCSHQLHLDAVQKLKSVKTVEDDLRLLETIRGASPSRFREISHIYGVLQKQSILRLNHTCFAFVKLTDTRIQNKTIIIP